MDKKKKPIATYKYNLYRYRKVKGYDEELVRAEFCPAKVNGFGVLLNRIKQTILPVKLTA